MLTLSIDPGETTGLAVYNPEEERIFTYEVEAFDDFVDVLKEFACLIDTVIYESFHIAPAKLRSMSWDEPFPSLLIGSIRTVFKDTNVNLVSQQPSTKIAVSDRLYKRLVNDGPVTVDMFDDSTHTKDALLHLFYYLIHKEKNKAFIKTALEVAEECT